MITIKQIEEAPKAVTQVYAVWRVMGDREAVVTAQSFATLKDGAETAKRQAGQLGVEPPCYENWFFTRDEAIKYAKDLNSQEQ